MTTPAQNKYALLSRCGKWYEQLPPVEFEKVMKQMKDWMNQMAAEGRIEGGERLTEKGAVVSGKNGVVIDGPFVESKEMIGGFIMIHANSLEEAVAIAKKNPSLLYGASMEVRVVDPVSPLG